MAGFFALRTYALWCCRRTVFIVVALAYVPGFSLNLVREFTLSTIIKAYRRPGYHATEGHSYAIGDKVRHLRNIQVLMLTFFPEVCSPREYSTKLYR